MLKQQIDLIKMNISRTDEKSKELEFYCSMFNSGLRDNLNDEVDEIERMLAKFEKKIREAFCFINPDMDELDVNPVIMLGGIETRVYEFIEQIENTDPLVFERMQRHLEREKRKAENQETEEQLKLRRLKRQTIVDARNQAEKVKIGRPLMKRSVPPVSKKKEEPNKLSQVEQAPRNNFFHSKAKNLFFLFGIKLNLFIKKLFRKRRNNNWLRMSTFTFSVISYLAKK